VLSFEKADALNFGGWELGFLLGKLEDFILIVFVGVFKHVLRADIYTYMLPASLMQILPRGKTIYLYCDNI
jgi:hypothetical protein